MRIVALLAARNEELYLARSLEHLLSQGIHVHVIDNQSTDNTVEIVSEFARRGGVTWETFPYPGYYDWRGLLRRKEQLSVELKADWFIHHDADELREAPAPFASLAEGIQMADTLGFNAIDFAEFVFTPTDRVQCFEGQDFAAVMPYYYYFAPRPLHRVNAWKKQHVPIDLVSSGGHCVAFSNRRIFPQPFILRHYVFLSFRHLCVKYGNRDWSPEELERGWHTNRASFRPEHVTFPPIEFFKVIGHNGIFDFSDPKRHHFFLRAPSGTATVSNDKL